MPSKIGAAWKRRCVLRELCVHIGRLIIMDFIPIAVAEETGLHDVTVAAAV